MSEDYLCDNESQDNESQDYEIHQDDQITANVVPFEAEKKYSNCKSLFEYIIQYLQDMKDQLHLDIQEESIDNCLNIMIHFKWSEELLCQSQYYDNDNIKVQLYQDGILFRYKIQKKYDKCVSCEKSQDLFQIGCNHFYCLECYEKHLQKNLNLSNNPKIKCIHKLCKIILPYSLILKLENILKQYKNIICQSYLGQDSQYILCIRKDCDNIISKTDQIYCSVCQSIYCINCQQDFHYPLSCDQARVWLKKVDMIKYYSKQILCFQYCFNCREPVNLEEYTYYANCRCGVQFCFNCGFDHEPYSSQFELNLTTLRNECLLIQESNFDLLHNDHILSLKKFKKYKEKLEDLRQKLSNIIKEGIESEQLQNFQKLIPVKFLASLKHVLELKSIILYMIPLIQYYKPQKWAEINKREKIDLNHLEKIILEQVSHFNQYVILLDQNLSQMEKGCFKHDEILDQVGFIMQLDQLIIQENFQLVQGLNQII